MSSDRKRRRVATPRALDNVQPLSASGEDAAIQQAAEKLEAFAFVDSDSAVKFPAFLLNALVGKIETIDYDGSPFKHCIHLKEAAWGDEAESEYLIIRESYRDLASFLSDSFRGWKSHTRIHRTITGTAGIGKTMFGLYWLVYYLRHKILFSCTMARTFGSLPRTLWQPVIRTSSFWTRKLRNPMAPKFTIRLEMTQKTLKC